MQQLHFHDPTPWRSTLAISLIGVYAGALFTPPICWLGRRFPIGQRNWLVYIPLHLLFSSVFSVAQLAVASAMHVRAEILPAVAGTTFWSIFSTLLVIGFHNYFSAYWIVLGVQYTRQYYRRYQEREQQASRLELHAAELKSQLMDARLNALKMQLQPHFLFNTLNAIMVLVRQQKRRQAEQMLARLSDLLRCVLEDVEAQEVPLRRELECLQLYLSIEQVRFQDRLQVEISADPAVLDAAVPQMGLQPIVENAVRHGVGRSSSAGRIQISAAQVGGTLELKVQDDGPGLPSAYSRQGRGIGLANTVSRLHQLYGDAAHLALENCELGGALVTMVLPYRLAPGASGMEVMEIHGIDHAGR